jgi:hypothetical protein
MLELILLVVLVFSFLTGVIGLGAVIYGAVKGVKKKW